MKCRTEHKSLALIRTEMSQEGATNVLHCDFLSPAFCSFPSRAFCPWKTEMSGNYWLCQITAHLRAFIHCGSDTTTAKLRLRASDVSFPLSSQDINLNAYQSIFQEPFNTLCISSYEKWVPVPIVTEGYATEAIARASSVCFQPCLCCHPSVQNKTVGHWGRDLPL